MINSKHLRDNVSLQPDFNDVDARQTSSDTGDEECHYELYGIKDKSARKYARNHAKPPNIKICSGNVGENATGEGLTLVHRRHIQESAMNQDRNDNG